MIPINDNVGRNPKQVWSANLIGPYILRSGHEEALRVVSLAGYQVRHDIVRTSALVY